MTGPALALLKVVELPGQPLVKFDISWVDPETRRYYFADRSNARIAVLDCDSLEYKGAIGEGDFTGVTPNSKNAGPNGVLVTRGSKQVWVGDGDSSTKVYDAASGELRHKIATGGDNRCDELAHDERDDLVLVANDAEPVPFASIIGADGSIVARIEFPRASNGLHQPAWDAETGYFYLSVSELDGDPARGEVAIIDALAGKVVGSIPIAECQPAGLVMGPGRQLCVACGKDAVEKGFAPATVVVDLLSNEQRRFTDAGGSDQVWYNPGDDRYYLAARAMAGGAVLGVIEAGGASWVTNLPTSPDAHSVAADVRTNRVFVPFNATLQHPRGGVAVFEQA